MRVYTVAGSHTATLLGDGGPATAASLSATEGVWLDGSSNVYISDMAHARIRKVDASTGIITTIAGTGTTGYSGDNGPATDARIKKPYGLYADIVGNVYFADMGNNVIRKIDVITGIITTIAGGGSSLGDGSAATNAQLYAPQNVYLDTSGNLFIGEIGRIRKVNLTTNIITTIAGNGTVGLSGDNGLATNAQVSNGPTGMIMDKNGNLYFADRSNHRIRKINSATGFITNVVGTTGGYSGDGGPATNAQLAGPISIAFDSLDNLIIGDNGNNFIRKVNVLTGIITTIAGVGNSITGSYAEGIPALNAEIHPEFIYLDRDNGFIYYSNWNTQIHKITNYNAKLSYGTELPELKKSICNIAIYPNPSSDILTIKTSYKFDYFEIKNINGQLMLREQVYSEEIKINISTLLLGTYHLRMYSNDIFSSKTFIKK